MNKLLKRISAGIMACMIAICGVLTIGNIDTYASNTDTLKSNACTGVNAAFGNYGSDQCEGYEIDLVWSWVYTILNWVLIAVGILCVVFIIIGAVKFMTSGGDPEKVKSGRNTLMYAIIGLVVAILANVIVQIVFNLTDLIITK